MNNKYLISIELEIEDYNDSEFPTSEQEASIIFDAIKDKLLRRAHITADRLADFKLSFKDLNNRTIRVIEKKNYNNG